MPRKIKITLWVAIGLTIYILLILPLSVLQPSGGMIVPGALWPLISGLIFALGILIIYWAVKTIMQVTLKRYLLLAGASSIGILFFLGLHFLVEVLMIIGLIVCPIALIVGAALALRFKKNLRESK